jgi:hypothetical protein
MIASIGLRREFITVGKASSLEFGPAPKGGVITLAG